MSSRKQKTKTHIPIRKNRSRFDFRDGESAYTTPVIPIRYNPMVMGDIAAKESKSSTFMVRTQFHETKQSIACKHRSKQDATKTKPVFPLR